MTKFLPKPATLDSIAPYWDEERKGVVIPIIGKVLHAKCLGESDWEEAKKLAKEAGKFIYVTTIYGNLEVFDKQGMYGHYDGECMLLPSKKERDWTKFVRFWNREEKVVTLLDGTKKFDPMNFEPFDKVLARDSSSEVWLPDFFYSSSPYIPIQCFGASWQQCIPYNEETKHLVGTKEDCPEYYKWRRNSYEQDRLFTLPTLP